MKKIIALKNPNLNLKKSDKLSKKILDSRVAEIAIDTTILATSVAVIAASCVIGHPELMLVGFHGANFVIQDILDRPISSDTDKKPIS